MAASKPTLTDVMSELTNINSRLYKIETGILGLKRNVSGLKTDVSGLKTDVSGLQTDMKKVLKCVATENADAFPLVKGRSASSKSATAATSR